MDVVDLREFYRSDLGLVTARLISRQLAGLGNPAMAPTIMGIGYATPYLQQLAPASSLTLSFMLAQQGVTHWPVDALNRAALVEASDLPLLESTIDLALVVHGLEFADTPLDTLQEIWRVMAPQGRLLLVVPNRRGLWAASEATPFGYGQPFSRGQLAGLLKDAKYSITQWRSALCLPPLKSPGFLKAAPAIEAMAERAFPRLSGVTIVEAMKQVYAFSSGKRLRRTLQRFRPVLLPSPQPSRRENHGPAKD
jgi:SAM-dependent methyltransferase